MSEKTVDAVNSRDLNESLASTPEEVDVKRLIRKIDLRLVPLVTFLYLFNFIDRTNIGNAKAAGLSEDLHLKGYDYNIALSAFYVAYILVEVPSNLLLKKVGSKWISVLVSLFGVMTIVNAFVKNFGGLIVCRILLGFAEGGTLPAIAYLLSRYYTRDELIFRLTIFLAIAPCLSGAFGGLLASGLLHVGHVGSVKSWRTIFLVEGIITTGVGILSAFFILEMPEKSTVFTASEREMILSRMRNEQVHRKVASEPTSSKLIIQSLKSLMTWACMFGFLLINISVQGLSLFMPTIVATLGHYSQIQVQLRTVPPYVVAMFWSIFISYMSLRFRRRGIFVMMSAPLSIIGYAIFVASHNSKARYAACFLGFSGVIPLGPFFLVWGINNASPDTVRAVTAAFIPGVATLGSVIATWTYLPNDAPNYHKGNSLNLASTSAVFVLALVLILYVRYENRRRERGDRDHRLMGKSPQEVDELGSWHPAYRYQD